MGLDIGDRRIGVAISDPSGMIATPLNYIEHIGKKQVAKEVESLIKEYGVHLIVVGMPLHLNGDFGERAEASKKLGDYLQRRLNIPVHYEDERLTTVMAENILIEGNMRREKRREKIDSMSAVLILEGYLNRRREL